MVDLEEELCVLPRPQELTVDGYASVAHVRLRAAGSDYGDSAGARAAAELSAGLASWDWSCEVGSSEVLYVVIGLVHQHDGGKVSWSGGDADQLPPPPAAARLPKLPNCDQAYIIERAGADELHLAAMTGVGLSYAVQTLLQLFRPVLQARGQLGSVAARLPLPRVVDYPDVEERGIWGGLFTASRLDWMAGLKLNYANQGSSPDFSRDRPVTAEMEPELMRHAAERGLRFVPEIVHLNFLDGTPRGYGLFTEYPELRGRGDGALAGRYFAHGGEVGDQHRTVNANHPQLVQVLAGWLEDIARQCPEGHQRVTCWLSERPCADEGAETAAAGGQFVLEARAFTAAWQQARLRYPGLSIRLFLSTTTSQRDEVVVAEAPADVGIVRCCILDAERLRAQPRDRFCNPALDNNATRAAGNNKRWLGSDDVPLTCNGRVETPLFCLPVRCVPDACLHRAPNLNTILPTYMENGPSLTGPGWVILFVSCSTRRPIGSMTSCCRWFTAANLATGESVIKRPYSSECYQ
jgi:hypothetical protein